jgi:hypothetical protein
VYRLDHININQKKVIHESLPINFQPTSLLLDEAKNKLWIVGSQDNTIVVYQRGDIGKYRLIKKIPDNDMFVAYANVFDDQISIIVGELENSYVNYRFFWSKDYGANWNEDPLIIPSYLKPVSFFKNLIWAYSGSGRIQHWQ